ncbi:MAG: phenylacetate--CoA ligase family protein [Alphaproteobacteria bacterium]
MENFSTGPYIGLSTVTPIEERITWLRRMRPQYLLAYSQMLEHLAFAAGASRPAESLQALLAISEQLTMGMRARVERSFGVPVHQNYGLNEVGIVACRCEAGCYHVHSEHCLVEIIDETGRVCTPGEVGRIIVTSLTNFAMPLIRYDTEDLALAIVQDCPCGRVLPSFGYIEGRYGRVAHLPAGTMALVMALHDTVEEMPIGLINDLREFQIHQFCDERMELRLVARAPLPDEFFTRINACWSNATKQNGRELSVRNVDVISRSPGGKFQVFTSDFMPTR